MPDFKKETRNDTKTIGRMTCRFPRPIRRDLTSSSYPTLLKSHYSDVFFFKSTFNSLQFCRPLCFHVHYSVASKFCQVVEFLYRVFFLWIRLQLLRKDGYLFRSSRVAILFLALVRISSGQVQPATDPPWPCNNNECCQKTNHQELDNSRRSTQSRYKPGQVPLCDNGLKLGWYRFISFVGGEMPTTKVDENRCGTIHPIWLRTPTGKHPRPSTTAAPVTVTACININERNGGCSFMYKVGVKFCPGNYFVYYLGGTPYCSIGYCAGKISLKAVNKSTMFEGETSW